MYDYIYIYVYVICLWIYMYIYIYIYICIFIGICMGPYGYKSKHTQKLVFCLFCTLFPRFATCLCLTDSKMCRPI